MNLPLAYAHLQSASQSYIWVVDHCPVCSKQHTHDGGSINGNPREQLG